MFQDLTDRLQGALRKLRGAPEAPVPQDLIAERLQDIADRVGAYDMPDMSTLDTETGIPYADAPVAAYRWGLNSKEGADE